MGFDVSSPSVGTGGPPSGPAGGALTGTYPNPTIASTATLNLASAAASADIIHVENTDTGGDGNNAIFALNDDSGGAAAVAAVNDGTDSLGLYAKDSAAAGSGAAIYGQSNSNPSAWFKCGDSGNTAPTLKINEAGSAQAAGTRMIQVNNHSAAEVFAVDNAGVVTLKALIVPTGASGVTGTATLTLGTVTVATTAVTASSKIYLTYDNPAGATVGILSAPSASISAGVHFVINSKDATDSTSTVNWVILN